MKRTAFLFLILFAILSCKKNDSKNQTQTDSLNPTGLSHATPAELAAVKSIKTVDTSQLRDFARIMDIPVTIEGLPEANDQVYGSCQSWALGYYLMSYYYRQVNSYPDLLLSPSFIYNQNATDANKGVSYVKVLEFTKQKGTCTWSQMPGNPSNFTDKPSPEATKNAVNFTVGDYFKFDQDDHPMIKTYLRRKMPIIIGFEPDEAWQLNGYKNNGDYILNSDGSYVWRSMNNYKKGSLHGVVVCGYSNDLKAFLIKNSWGKDWGQNGYMWIDYTIFEKVVLEAYLAVPRFVTTDHIDDGKVNPNAKGNVTNWGFFQVKSRGFCYSTDPNPTVDDPNDLQTLVSGGGEGDFSLAVQALKVNKTYYLRAFASSNSQTYYGNEQSFTTGDVTIPTITTTAASALTSASAVSGGNITNDGGSPITARGVCWSTLQNPTIADSKTSDGMGAGSFISSISGLTSNIKYFVRAYATNSQGTAYGNEVQFTSSGTQNTFTDSRDGQVYTYKQIGTQIWMTQNLNYAAAGSLCYDNNSGNCTIYMDVYMTGVVL